MSKLPPLINLPSWSRSSLERRKVQRSITKDPVIPTSKGQVVNPSPIRRDSGLKLPHSATASSSRIVSAPSSPQDKARSKREAQLQNSISFLQEQHQETLSKLHEEIEKLKGQNKGDASRTILIFLSVDTKFIYMKNLQDKSVINPPISIVYSFSNL